MMSIICVAFLYSCFMAGTTLADALDKNLLMIKAGGKVELDYMWRTTGQVNDPLNTKHSWNLYNLTRGDNFRSSLIDSWDADPPDEISINLCNTQGDVLWWIKFNSSKSNIPFSWMMPEKILDSSSNIQRSMVSWVIDKLKYQTYLSPTLDKNRAWFAVWNGEVFTMDYPVFLFSNDPEHSQPLLETDFQHIGKEDADYRGCWPGYSLDRILRKEDMTGMTVDMCNKECIEAGKPFILLEKRYKCWCGNFISNPRNRFDALCEAECPGNPLQICGSNEAMHAVFPIQQVPVPEIPMAPVLWKTLGLGSWRNEYMVELSEFLQHSKFPVFLNAVAVSLDDVNVQPIFTLHYNDFNCNSTNRKPYRDQQNVAKVFKADGELAPLEVIPARCLWIIFEASNSITTGVTMNIYRPNDPYFISAPALVIQGHWKEEQVTTKRLTTGITNPDLSTFIPDTTTYLKELTETSTSKTTTSVFTQSSYTSTAEKLPSTSTKLTSQYQTSNGISTEAEKSLTIEQQETGQTSTETQTTDRTSVKTFPNMEETSTISLKTFLNSVATSTTDLASESTYPTSKDTSTITIDRTSSIMDQAHQNSIETSTVSLKTFPNSVATSTTDLASESTYPTSEDTSTITIDRTSNKMDQTHQNSLETSSTDRTSATTFTTKQNTRATQSTTTTKILNSSKENTKPETALCKCICFSKTILINDSHELKEHIEELQKNLTVNKTQLSSHIRKLKSASDDRVSAQRIGYVGATFLSLIAGFILFIDLIDVVRIINKKTSKRRAFGHLN